MPIRTMPTLLSVDPPPPPSVRTRLLWAIRWALGNDPAQRLYRLLRANGPIFRQGRCDLEVIINPTAAITNQHLVTFLHLMVQQPRPVFPSQARCLDLLALDALGFYKHAVTMVAYASEEATTRKACQYWARVLDDLQAIQAINEVCRYRATRSMKRTVHKCP